MHSPRGHTVVSSTAKQRKRKTPECPRVLYFPLFLNPNGQIAFTLSTSFAFLCSFLGFSAAHFLRGRCRKATPSGMMKGIELNGSSGWPGVSSFSPADEICLHPGVDSARV